MKELKGDDESNEEWDGLKWGSLHGLAKDKRYGMKQRTMGKPTVPSTHKFTLARACIRVERESISECN